ncbi:hypothetical protein Vretimale_6644 [Volvox reticuliferus]|uniref:Uncharacterized protein n=1 Tax=Volvox reticuliferus TaxID=1737510 RepID=A0A8J4LM18_9CHLO|nr:hypothetical protein Vretifemale_7245 [Volvox reticuliferus]GIM01931.1 hypothetical protein Vretimale_6644 [Volvox reticuliferus]
MQPFRAPCISRTPTGAGTCNSNALALSRHARLQPCHSSKPDVAEPPALTSTSVSAVASTTLGTRGGAIATFKASKLGRQPIVEAQRPLAEYMALPASQYSVLDARRIERVDETTFRCYVGELRFFSWSVEPVITVSVTVEQGGCTIRLLGCKLQGSRFVEDINDKFSATMTNVVRYRDYVPPSTSGQWATVDEHESEDEEEGRGGDSVGSRPQKEIASDTTIQVCVEVPPWSSFLPVATIESVGSSVMQNVLNLMVPRFLKQLRSDYELWASGDVSRRPVGEL